jgi:hypothetical protein
MAEITEQLLKAQKDLKEWKVNVLTRDQERCVNCGLSDRVAAVFIVPREAGGKLLTSNGATICRNCRIASEGIRMNPVKIEQKTPINFFISEKLHSSLNEFVKANTPNVGSVSGLIRRMMNSFITDYDLYPDIAQWQDQDGADVKINCWVNGASYTVFKMLCQELNLSYTDALKGLLLMAIAGVTSEDKIN